MKLPLHKAALYLTHNDHKNSYEDLADYLETHKALIDFEDEESKQKCLKNDSLWTLQWYPETPNGFGYAGAATLEELIAYVQRGEEANKLAIKAIREKTAVTE
jgi:hypothetical protein